MDSSNKSIIKKIKNNRITMCILSFAVLVLFVTIISLIDLRKDKTGNKTSNEPKNKNTILYRYKTVTDYSRWFSVGEYDKKNDEYIVGLEFDSSYFKTGSVSYKFLYLDDTWSCLLNNNVDQFVCDNYKNDYIKGVSVGLNDIDYDICYRIKGNNDWSDWKCSNEELIINESIKNIDFKLEERKR